MAERKKKTPQKVLNKLSGAQTVFLEGRDHSLCHFTITDFRWPWKVQLDAAGTSLVPPHLVGKSEKGAQVWCQRLPGMVGRYVFKGCFQVQEAAGEQEVTGWRNWHLGRV